MIFNCQQIIQIVLENKQSSGRRLASINLKQTKKRKKDAKF